jgi:hypothetical protein
MPKIIDDPWGVVQDFASTIADHGRPPPTVHGRLIAGRK